MKRTLYILLLLVATILLTGCLVKRKAITITKDNIKADFHVKDSNNYKLSTDIKDFRSSREDGVINAKDFMIGIDISDEISYTEFKGDFNKLKKAYQKEEDFKEVTYSGLKGFQRYNISYIRYEVYLPIKNDNTKVLIVNIYSNANKDEITKELYQGEEIKDILNHISVSTIKKK